MLLEQVLRGVWAVRGRVALAALLLFALLALVVVTWPRSYVARGVVAPAESTGIATSSLLAPASLLANGGLLDNRPGGNFAIYLDALRSAEAVEMLARETPLLDYLTRLRGAGLMGALREALGLRLEADLDDARNWLDRNLAVTQSTASITFALELKHRDRGAALEALARLHGFAEAKVRNDLADLAARRVAALRRQLEAENDLYVRQSLYELLGQQQRAGLVVGADRTVAARVVSAPMVEQRPSVPNRPLLLMLLAVAVPLAVGGLVFALVLLGWQPKPWRRPRRPVPGQAGHGVAARDTAGPLGGGASRTAKRAAGMAWRQGWRRGFGLW